MTKVKICGLTRAVDIEYVNELKPEYIGFVFAKSKRQVSAQQALKLSESLSKEIKTVGVFVNESIENVKEIAEIAKLHVLQFHGSEDLEYMKQFENYEVWKALSIKDESDLIGIEKYENIRLLLDSKVEGMQGGSGKAFNWNILREYNLENKIILAGGLGCHNVEEALRTVQPFAVDVSSGVESHGVKDYEKIKEFIGKVRGF